MLRRSSDNRPLLPSLYGWQVLGRIMKVVEQTGSFQRRYRNTFRKMHKEIYQTERYLSPATSHTMQVLIPPPRTLSRVASPVVKISSSGRVSNALNFKRGTKLRTLSNNCLTSMGDALHFFATSWTEANRRSASVCKLAYEQK